MTTPENFVYTTDTENLPSPEGMPDGSYKYVFDGVERGIIFARIQPSVPDHPELQHKLSPSRRFNPLIDDAGRFRLSWQESEEEMLAETKILEINYKDQDKLFDSVVYLASLRAEYGQTRIELDHHYGSIKLEYTPNLRTRGNFIERLQEIFPKAQIILK